MQEIVPDINKIGAEDSDVFWHILKVLELDDDREHYEKCFEHHRRGDRDVVIAAWKGDPIGFCVLNWQPKYIPFKNENKPEIQDLNVLVRYRNKGVGRRIIDFCEAAAVAKGCHEMGIGVGLDSSFGAAQRLYIKMGYVPDGHGVNYDRKQIAAGEFRPIDENLCLMMTKSIT